MPSFAKLSSLRKNTTKTSQPECLDFLSKIHSEHKIILSQDRSLANCLFHSLLLFQADFPSIHLSHKEMLHPQLKMKTFGFGSSPMKWENLVPVKILLRHSVMLYWYLALDTQSETNAELPSRMLVKKCLFSQSKVWTLMSSRLFLFSITVDWVISKSALPYSASSGLSEFWWAKVEIGSIWQKGQCALSQIRFGQSAVIL